MKTFLLLREPCQKFAECTSVAGFGQIRRSSHPAESLFWLFTIVVCACLAVRDCIPHIVNYMNDMSISTIDVIYNDTVFYAGSSICVQVDTTELKIRNFSVLQDATAFASFASCLLNEPCYKHANFFQLFLDQVFAATKILSSYHRIENGLDHQIDASMASLAGIPDVFYQRVSEQKYLSTRQLASALGFVFCSRMAMQVKYTRKKKTKNFDFCSSAQLVWFGLPPRSSDETDLLCYNIENFTTFKNMDEKYELLFYPRRVLENRELDSQFAYFSVDETPVTTDESSNYATVLFDTCLYVELDLTTRITLLSGKGHPCDPNVPYMECYARCSILALADICGCRSVSNELYIDDYKIDANTSCIKRFSPPHTFVNCSATAHQHRKPCTSAGGCLQKCEKNIFHMVQSECSTEHEPNSTAVVYRLHRRFYSHIREQLQYDIPTLVSSLGGVIGLWLGVGIIGLLKAVMFIPKAFAECVGVSKKVSERDEIRERLANIEAQVATLKAGVENEVALVEVER